MTTLSIIVVTAVIVALVAALALVVGYKVGYHEGFTSRLCQHGVPMTVGCADCINDQDDRDRAVEEATEALEQADEDATTFRRNTLKTLHRVKTLLVDCRTFEDLPTVLKEAIDNEAGRCRHGVLRWQHCNQCFPSGIPTGCPDVASHSSHHACPTCGEIEIPL